MKNLKQITQIVFVIFLLSCVKMPIQQSMKVENETTTTSLNYFDANDKISYDFFNDDKNLHVYIATAEYTTQMKILKFGFTLWLDQEGKKNKDKGIIFPLEMKGGNDFKRGRGRSTAAASNPSDKMQQMLAQIRKQFEVSPKIITLIGMEDDNSRININTELEKSDISVSITFDSLNVLRYKAIIPIEKIFTDVKYRDNLMSIGFASGFLEMDMNDMPQGRNGGGMSGGGNRGSMQGGGMQGGGRPGGSGGNASQYQKLMESVDVWFKVSLNPIN